MRAIGRESAKSFEARERAGFWRRYAPGIVLDIGYRGDTADAVPILPGAAGIEIGSPGYDGLHLPYGDKSVHCVHTSHVLEHVPDPTASLREWFRVLRVDGYLILFVPHAHLYERRLTVPPSRWSGEHLWAFTPASLLQLIEGSLAPNTYRVRHFCDSDSGYRYDLPHDVHPLGVYEIECVLQKIKPPTWRIEP